MTEFIRPNLETVEINDNLTRFIVAPLERGYGETLGNTLRRVLLNSLTGARATAIKIEGVDHEFTTADGVIEDIADIVLNVKGLVFRPTNNPESGDDNVDYDTILNLDNYSALAHLDKTGPCTVTGADLEVPAEFELINKDHHIATISEGGSLNMDLRIGVGRGRVVADQNKREDDPIGIIAIDSNFSPVKRCTMKKENTRVGQHTDFDSLTLEIETDGSITPAEAANRAAYIVNQHMDAFLDLIERDEKEKDETIFAPEAEKENIELEKRVDDLDLSVRSYNCLKRADINTVRELVGFSERDLLNIRNFGSKSIDEVKAKLVSMGLSLRQDLG
ncbi:MAG: DNA-directed RNA polymerase subunit alpha [Coriobacteriia bacterium]|nr:DNA-directed RNA polymerase subunit alpha [Coriobacteriia bacterium]